MKPANFLAPAAFVLMSAQPGEANIGQALGVFGDLWVKLVQIITHFDKRDLASGDFVPLEARQGRPPGVPQFEYDRCADDLTGLTITVQTPAANALSIAGVPATCMNLATVLVGDPVAGPYALPCGSDCLIYQDLSQADFDALVGFFRSVG
ncbi:hypothetical protein ACHAQA_003230 [Verticillium albo-atrum]